MMLTETKKEWLRLYKELTGLDILLEDGIKSQEIECVMASTGYSLPDVYKCFLIVFGAGQENTFIQGKGFRGFPEVLEYQSELAKQKHRIGLNLDECLDKKVILFRSVQNEEFWYFNLDEGDDPFVHHCGYTKWDQNFEGLKLSEHVQALFQSWIEFKRQEEKDSPVLLLRAYKSNISLFSDDDIIVAANKFKKNISYYLEGEFPYLRRHLLTAIFRSPENYRSTRLLFELLVHFEIDELDFRSAISYDIVSKYWIKQFVSTYGFNYKMNVVLNKKIARIGLSEEELMEWHKVYLKHRSQSM